nr:FixH family protein [uncultured Flavobacterium sp.]
MMKLKLNWGSYIVIAFALFMTFILYFVVKVQSDSKYDNDLVVEEYYKHDIHYQEEMQRVQNAQDLPIKPQVSQLENEVTITFPANFDPKIITGNVALYRPSNKKLDFQVKLALTEPVLHIPKTNLVGGSWDINMEWQYKGKAYLTKETIYIK